MSRKLSDLEPDTAAKCSELLVAAARLGIKLTVTQTLRSYAEQDTLYAQGRTTEGLIVTQAKGGESWHNFGRAFDVAFGTDKGGVVWEGPWEQVGALGESLGLSWGGRWHKHADRPHFENAGGLTLAEQRTLHEAQGGQS